LDDKNQASPNRRASDARSAAGSPRKDGDEKYSGNGKDILSAVANTPIIEFYSGAQPDHRGRYLNEIQGSPDAQLESVHDYIQWLFPLPERSGFNVAAPVLTHESIHAFRTRPELQEKLRASFLRMMNFYGFEARLGERVMVTRAPNFAAKAAGWLSPGDHNHLRITRILRCLTVLGLEAAAMAFFDCLCEIYEDEQNKPLPAISDKTMRYWKEAVGSAGIG
jgi:hypothetical protein